MKPAFLYLLISCMLPHALLAQAPRSLRSAETDSIQQSLIDNEKHAYRTLFDQPVTEDLGFTVASGNFHVNYYRCEWQTDPNVRFITGKVTSHFTVNSTTNSITYDLSDTLAVDSITWHGTPISFQRPGSDGLVLQLPVTLNASQQDSVSIYYKGVPRLNIPNGGFSISVLPGNEPVLWTLSEPYGAKEWWPCKNGLSDKADSIDFAITCPSAYTGVSNGVLAGSQVNGSNTTFYYKHRYPAATYLVAFAVANYVQLRDTVQIGAYRMPILFNYTPPSYYNLRGGQTVVVTLLSLFSKLFGDYPFVKEQYSQTQVRTGGGMEHQTNSFLNSDNYQLAAHELCHQWFGDRVTCGSWRDIWLNEGFGDYSQFLALEYFEPNIRLLHLQAHANIAMSKPAGSVYVDDTTSVNRIFSNQLSYCKGGYVLHMLRGMLGDSVFFLALRTYLGDPSIRYSFAKTADIQRNFEQVSGKDLSTFFKKWIYGQGYPNYNAAWMQNSNGWVRVQLNQTTSDPSVSFYEMPVQLKLMNARGDTTLVTVDHRQSGQIYWFNPGFTVDSIAIDPNLWILAKTKVSVKQPAASTVANDLKIYPNPSPTHLYISLMNPVATSLDITLYNAAGQLVYKAQHRMTGQDELIDIPTGWLARGVYMLKLTDNGNIRMVKKLVR